MNKPRTKSSGSKYVKKTKTIKIAKNSSWSKDKYPYLNPKKVLPIRREALEIDYAHKLNDSEKEFLNQFFAEFVGADFRKGRRFHTTPSEKKLCNANNNHRNKDVLSRSNSRDLTLGTSAALHVLEQDELEISFDDALDFKQFLENNEWDKIEERFGITIDDFIPDQTEEEDV